MGAIFGVQFAGRADHSEASEAQLREGDRAWSVNRKPRYTNRNCGGAGQGEQAIDCEALVAKGEAPWMRRLCGGGSCALAWGVRWRSAVKLRLNA